MTVSTDTLMAVAVRLSGMPRATYSRTSRSRAQPLLEQPRRRSAKWSCPSQSLRHLAGMHKHRRRSAIWGIASDFRKAAFETERSSSVKECSIFNAASQQNGHNSMFPLDRIAMDCQQCREPDARRMRRNLLQRIFMRNFKHYECRQCGHRFGIKINGVEVEKLQTGKSAVQ